MLGLCAMICSKRLKEVQVAVCCFASSFASSCKDHIKLPFYDSWIAATYCRALTGRRGCTYLQFGCRQFYLILRFPCIRYRHILSLRLTVFWDKWRIFIELGVNIMEFEATSPSHFKLPTTSNISVVSWRPAGVRATILLCYVGP